jgi:hypothetical protein
MKLVIITLLFCSSAEAGSIYPWFVLLRQRRVEAGNGLGTGLGTTIKKVLTC